MNLPKQIKEALAVHEAFRRLGFPSENIFISFDEENDDLLVILEWNADFVVHCGKWTEGKTRLIEVWDAAVDWWNGAATDEEMHNIWFSSKVFELRSGFTVKLIECGIKIPCFTEQSDLN